MSAFVGKERVRHVVGPLFIVAFVVSLLVEHFTQGLAALAFPCLAVEVLCLAAFGWQRQWLLTGSAIILITVTATGLP